MTEAKNAIGSVDEGFSIEVELLVSQGHIGIILFGDDVSSPVGQEHMVAAKLEPSTVLITVPRKTSARRLIFRNTAANMRSQFTLKRVTFVSWHWID